MPARGGQPSEQGLISGVFVQMKWLRIELCREVDNIVARYGVRP